MSSQRRNDRRREESRGSTTATALNPPSRFNSNSNGNTGDSNYSSSRLGSRNRGGFVRRRYRARPSFPKNEPESTLGPEDVPQLVHEIEDKLAKRAVECMICYETVGRSARIWSCSNCYAIFHLSCIKKWARISSSVDFSVNWRCPGCQSVQLSAAEEIRYVCFCGKQPNPSPRKYLDLTPHSCGQPCWKPLEKEVAGGDDGNDGDRCPHVCLLDCHPGPCPPCNGFALPRRCPCGKKKITTRCSDRNSKLSCGKLCNKLLECSFRHRCKRICHEGPCDPCQVSIKALCFCKKKKVEFLLCKAFVTGDDRQICGAFSCNSTCGLKLACGNHYCGKICHSGPCGDCELTIKTCYCGKTKIQNGRQSCIYPIPRCSQICGKLLPCGFRNHHHYCKELCHSGNCPPCMVRVIQVCRCGSSYRIVECCRMKGVEFVCGRHCSRGLITSTSTAIVPSLAGGGSGHSNIVFEGSVIQRLPVPAHPVEATGKKVSLGQRNLVIAVIVFVAWCLLSKLFG